MKSDRTTLITAVAVAGVLLASSAAVAANIGILNSTSGTTIGSLTATDNLVPAAPVEAQSVVEINPTARTVTAPSDFDRDHTAGHESYEGANDDD